ncbi:MAG TPA: hypothetical protein VMS55_24195 [Myxococcota bacterium]|nr:hypothetical protein [Myxococcota bacterium]
MRRQEARELAARLRSAELRVAYFPHRYAAWLLARAAGAGAAARALKQRHARWLDNGLVREVAARAADGVLTRSALEQVGPHRAEIYRIDFSIWGPKRAGDGGPWYQTTRPGVNLVLLLNFPHRHNAAYRRWLDPDGAFPAVGQGHPHACAPEITLAWARLDVDLDIREALIEEVQCDWLRWIGSVWEYAADMRDGHKRDRYVQRCFRNRVARFDRFERYWLRVLAHHRSWWAEATLFAALWVLVEQLGVRRIWYHTHEGGVRRKQILRTEPPRSLYTQLPRRFGFELTTKSPALLRWSRKEQARDEAISALPWYRLVV